MRTHLDIRPGLAIPLAEIELRTSRSSGPGGQHANVTASRVEASFDVAASSALDDAAKARIGRARISASAQDTRSQHQNRELALDRLAERIERALRVRRPRTATRPTAASARRRAETKRRRSEVKRARRRPDPD